MCNLKWNEDGDNVYGAVKHYGTEEKFQKAIYEYLKGMDNIHRIIELTKEKCVSTEDGLQEDCIIPLNCTDIQIEDYYIAIIEYEEA